MTHDDRPTAESDPSLPPALADDLAKLAEARVAVPPNRDEAVLAAARSHLAQTTAQPRRDWWVLAAVGSAAMLLLAGIITLNMLDPDRQPAQQAQMLDEFAAEDITGDGQVNIIDAMVLARRVEQNGQATQVEQWDLNDDGTVDRIDAGLIAMRVVDLKNFYDEERF